MRFSFLCQLETEPKKSSFSFSFEESNQVQSSPRKFCKMTSYTSLDRTRNRTQNQCLVCTFDSDQDWLCFQYLQHWRTLLFHKLCTWSSRGISNCIQALRQVKVTNTNSDLLCRILRTIQVPPIILSCDIFHKRRSYSKTSRFYLFMLYLWDKVGNTDGNFHCRSCN